MNKKTVKLSSKRKVEIQEMSRDDADFCKDIAYIVWKNGEFSHETNTNKCLTAWLRRGIVGGDFKDYKTNKDGYPADSVLNELNSSEVMEVASAIAEYQRLGE